MGNIIIPVDDKLYATLSMQDESFPLVLSHDDLSNFAHGFVNWHRQTTLEISVILEGSVRVCLLRGEHRLRAGESFLVLPNTLHAVQPVANEAGRYVTLIFEPRLLTGFPGSFFDNAWYAPLVPACGGFVRLSGLPGWDAIRAHVAFACERAGHADAGAQLAVQRALQDAWRHIAPALAGLQDAARREDRRIVEMTQYLRAHYAEKFSLDAMAAHLHVSRGECCRYFKRMMGMTITDYLLDYRLSHAAQQLAQTSLPVTQIAHASGFNSPSSFAQFFRKKTGLTPSAYRAQKR